MTGQRFGSKIYQILILCLQTLVREGLRLLMAEDEDLHVIAAVDKVDACLATLSRLKADVIVVAIGWEGEAYTGILQQLKSTCPDLPLLVISPDTHPESVQTALEVGAAGYLPLTASLDELVQAVFTVCQGELAVHTSILPSLYVHLAGQSAAEEICSLEEFSSRQQEVLACLVDGLSDREIAQELFISVRTVQTHLAHVYKKLGVHSRTETAVIALRAGWFSHK